MKYIYLCIIIIYFKITISAAIAVEICNVPGIGAELSKFSLDRCEGNLNHREAIDCLNRKIDESADQRERAEKAISQAECLCKAINEMVDGFGSYSRLKGTCSVER